MDTSHCLVDEIMLEFGRRSRRLDSMTRFKNLCWRKAIHDGTRGNVILNGAGRAAGIGVAVLLIRSDGSVLKPYIVRRTDKVGSWPNALHVAPSGMLDYYGDYAEYDVLTAAKCEYLEELFHDENCEKDYLKKLEHQRNFIEDRFQERTRGTVRFRLVGVAIDLFNLRPEICVVGVSPLDINIRPNEEIANPHPIPEFDLQRLTERFVNWMPPEHSVPSGAAAFYYGCVMLQREGLDLDDSAWGG